MFKAEFELEAITPIFMRGADQSKAEIRASSIKGLMRWWFRALAGNYFGNDIVGLRKAENYVFGNTGQRSRVVVEVDAPEPEKFNFSSFKDLTYLWFSIKLAKPKINYYYPAETKFTLKIRAVDESSFRLTVYSLWLISNFGGIGFRSRRGGGSVMATVSDVQVPSQELEDQILNLFRHNWRDLKDTHKFWEFAVRELYERFSSNVNKRDEINSYPTLNDIIVLEYGDSFSNYFKALQKLGKTYAGALRKSKSCSGRVRQRYEDGVRFDFADRDDPNCNDFSHVVIRDFKNLQKDTKERRFYFGLPLIYSNWKTEVVGYNPKNPREPYRRRGSSVILTVKKDERGFVPLVVILPYQFLPNHDGKFVIIKGKKQRTFQLPTNNQWFVNWLKVDVTKRFEERGFVRLY